MYNEGHWTNRQKEHLIKEEFDGLEKLRSLLFHHSWASEAALLASHIELNKKLIHSIKSIEVMGCRRTRKVYGHGRHGSRVRTTVRDIPATDNKLRIYNNLLNVFNNEFAHRFY